MTELDLECAFCQVLQKDSHNQVIARCAEFTAIKKPYKSKQVNFLVIANTHVESLKDNDVDYAALVAFIRELAAGEDWCIKVSNGKQAGQTVFHMHVHVSSYNAWDSWQVLRNAGQEGLQEPASKQYAGRRRRQGRGKPVAEKRNWDRKK